MALCRGRRCTGRGAAGGILQGAVRGTGGGRRRRSSGGSGDQVCQERSPGEGGGRRSTCRTARSADEGVPPVAALLAIRPQPRGKAATDFSPPPPPPLPKTPPRMSRRQRRNWGGRPPARTGAKSAGRASRRIVSAAGRDAVHGGDACERPAWGGGRPAFFFCKYERRWNVRILVSIFCILAIPRA